MIHYIWMIPKRTVIGIREVGVTGGIYGVKIILGIAWSNQQKYRGLLCFFFFLVFKGWKKWHENNVHILGSSCNFQGKKHFWSDYLAQTFCPPSLSLLNVLSPMQAYVSQSVFLSVCPSFNYEKLSMCLHLFVCYFSLLKFISTLGDWATCPFVLLSVFYVCLSWNISKFVTCGVLSVLMDFFVCLSVCLFVCLFSVKLFTPCFTLLVILVN